ncbi:hypothetical protein BRARA_H01828 [Brassica rapa]|uniref:RING-type domain-containing protein n=1 Tax=Brassica campestris TaxID=3711 RepID=A0A397YCG4_BRACM|nr:hypothetical protein BRARA_H01828 [Brassica rapa]
MASSFSNRRPPSPASSTSSSHLSSRLIPRSSSTSASSFTNSGSRSMTTLTRTFSDSGLIGGSGSFGTASPVPYPSEELLGEPVEETVSSERDSISVTVRFRPLSDREYQRGDEVAWYPDGDTMVRHEYNPLTAYAFDKVFGPQANTMDVYDVAARPVVKAAMEGVNGTVFAYGVTSSGKTHTMHGDQESPGIIPLAIKDVFSIIQDTPGREFLLRVSYLEIYNEGTYVEGIKEEVVLSPGHALSFIAAGEETPKEEPLVARLKARMQEMKEKEMKSQANGDANSHICKVCFESPTAAILLPCRHFCLCRSCSLACLECPICRTKISDRLFAFPS